MIELADQAQRGADLRRASVGRPGCDVGGLDADENGQPLGWGRRRGAPARVQRFHGVTVLVEIIDGLVQPAAGADER